MKSMNLGDSARRSEWPECTRGTLVTLGLWLHSQAHIVKSIGIPGAEGMSQVYSDLAARIDIFIEEGLKVLIRRLRLPRGRLQLSVRSSAPRRCATLNKVTAGDWDENCILECSWPSRLYQKGLLGHNARP